METTATANQREDNKRKKIIVALIIALIAVLSIGGTLAYLTATTNTKSNVFTSGATKITASLYETAWDGSTASSTNPASDVDTNSAYGVNIAKSMLPGSTAPKDPKIANTNATGGESEYVAIRVKFLNNNGEALTPNQVTALLSQLAIYSGTNSNPTAGFAVNSNWTADSANGTSTANGVYYFYYSSAIAPQASTEALFDNVTILPTADTTYMSTNSGFQIQVDGAAVQASSFTNAAAAQTTLKGLFS